MHYILIDDNQSALRFLAEQLCGAFKEALDLTKVTLIRPNVAPTGDSLKELLTRLQNEGRLLHDYTEGFTREAGLARLVGFINEIAKSEEPAILISDLNMSEILLNADTANGGWLDASGELRIAISEFLKPEGRFLILYSGHMRLDRVEKSIVEKGGRATSCRMAFDIHPSTSQAEELAKEIVDIVGRTTLETLWALSAGNSVNSVNSWFSGDGVVPHNWHPGLPQNEDYVKEIASGLGISGDIKSYANKALHDSLKGIVGSHFCGSPVYQKRDGYVVEKDKPLLLGSIAIISLLALKVESRDLLICLDLFKTLSPELAKRPYRSDIDGDETRSTAVALYWMFRKCFDHSHGGSVLAFESFRDGDGFRIRFDWETEDLFAQAKNLKQSLYSLKSDSRYNRPSNSKQALAAAVQSLLWHPGRVLRSHHDQNAIDIRSVLTT